VVSSKLSEGTGREALNSCERRTMIAMGASPCGAESRRPWTSLLQSGAALQRPPRGVAERAFAGAPVYDEDGAFPATDIRGLREADLLTFAMAEQVRLIAKRMKDGYSVCGFAANPGPVEAKVQSQTRHGALNVE
jgi:hypothetical protein